MIDPDLCYRLPIPIEQKGMTFDHDFSYSFPLWSSLIKKGRRNREWIAKIVIKSHAFLLLHLFLDLKNGSQEILKEICLIDVGNYDTVGVSIYIYIQYTYVSIYLYSIYICIYLSLYLSIYLYINLSIYLPNCLYIWLIYSHIYIYLSIYLSMTLWLMYIITTL